MYVFFHVVSSFFVFKPVCPSSSVTSACATGSHSIGTALDFMLRGESDIMLAGGAEAAMSPLCFAVRSWFSNNCI